MTMMSPLGKVPRRVRQRRKGRRAWPLVCFVLVFAVAAGVVWWRVLTTDNHQTTSSSQCSTATPPAKLQPKDVSVRVYNATNRDHLAADVTATLKKRGLQVLATANDPTQRTVSGVAEVRYGPSGTAEARYVQALFPGSTMVQDDRTSGVVDIALGPAYKSVASTAAFHSALQKLSTSPSASASCVPAP